MLGLQRNRVQINLNLPHLAAIRRRYRRARHRGQLRADEVLAKVEQLLLTDVGAGHGQLQNRHRGRVVVQDQRRCDARRHLLEHGLRDRRHLGGRGADIDVRLEEDFDDTVARQRLRFNMVNIVDRGAELAFIVINHPSRHVFGRQAGIGPDGADHRNPDVREYIGRGTQGGEWAENQDQQRQHHKGIGPLQRNAYKREHTKTPSPVAGRNAHHRPVSEIVGGV